jgi:hypothetical protein
VGALAHRSVARGIWKAATGARERPTAPEPTAACGDASSHEPGSVRSSGTTRAAGLWQLRAECPWAAAHQAARTHTAPRFAPPVLAGAPGPVKRRGFEFECRFTFVFRAARSDAASKNGPGCPYLAACAQPILTAYSRCASRSRPAAGEYVERAGRRRQDVERRGVLRRGVHPAAGGGAPGLRFGLPEG